RLPSSPLLPYTTLFRSHWCAPATGGERLDGQRLTRPDLRTARRAAATGPTPCCAAHARRLDVGTDGGHHTCTEGASSGRILECGDRKSTRLNSSHVSIS